jgi:hypothetical protein
MFCSNSRNEITNPEAKFCKKCGALGNDRSGSAIGALEGLIGGIVFGAVVGRVTVNRRYKRQS